MSAPSFRVHFVTHHDGRKTGILIRRWDAFFDAPPPTAYAADEDDVLALLEQRLLRMEADGEPLDRYLWTETFHTRQARVDVHPLATVKKRPVIGKATIPLRVTYAYTALEPGDAEGGPRAYRVMLPRLGAWLVLEDLDAAPEVLRVFLSTALLGEQPRWIYDYRAEGEEYVRAWSPQLLARRAGSRRDEGEPPPPELAKVADDWVALLKNGKLPLVVGDAPELQRLMEAVSRVPPASVVLVGPSGAGKTALVRRFVRALVERARGRDLPEPHLWSTSADRILAGMVYLGMWQERCLKLVDELSGRAEYLYVDRLSGFTRPQHDGTSIADVFEPAIAAGDVSILAEATPSELERLERRSPSLLARFRIVHVSERSIDRTIELVGPYAAKKDGVALHPSAVSRLVRHADALERDQALPGKAFRFVDWLAQTEGAPPGAAKRTFYGRDVSEAFSKYTGIPLDLISDEHAASASDLAARLRARVIGQDAACAACGRLLARFKAAMNDPERPVGTLLFVGPTGVGKTELAKQLARTTFGDETRLVRVDMSEYGLRGSASRLLEVGEGVTSLAQQVRARPLSVVLLDEIEKAHAEVFDLLLGLLGEGRLTDATGRLVDFRGTIVVMTSNLGATEQAPVGFASARGDDYLRAVRQHFRPELFNRIDQVLSFRALAPEDVQRIVDLSLDDVRARTGLVRRGMTLRVTSAARSRLAELGFHPTRGARPLKRVIEERVVTPIAAALAREPGLRDRTIQVLAGDEPGSGDLVVRVD